MNYINFVQFSEEINKLTTSILIVFYQAIALFQKR